MPPVPYIPETAPFTAEQRAWLNGFLAGLFSQLPAGTRPGVAPSPGLALPTGSAVEPAEPLLILFGSQTGTAEGLARRVAQEARRHGFAPRVLALNDYEQANLAAGGQAIIISSTWGDGDPPDNAANFWSWLNSGVAPPLQALRFAVLGLGDRNYSDFCGASKKFDARLEALGAKRLIPRGECDVDYEATARTWLSTLWDKLGVAPSRSTTNGAGAKVNGAASTNGSISIPALPRNKSSTVPARPLKNVLLSKPGSAKEIRHYEISLEGSGLAYEVGDALGVAPLNCPCLVDELLAALKCKGDEPVTFDDTTVALREALARHFDITKPAPDLLAAIALRAPGSELATMLEPKRAADLKQWLCGRDILDLLRLLQEPFPLEEFLPLLRKLAPRLYSISSSPKAHPGEVHLTVSTVRYQSFGRNRKGVASTFLAERVDLHEALKVFAQPSPGFKLPAKGETPLIMVGPGTGIAPFRAFLHERQITGAKGRNWLFFGDQKQAGDFLYQEELTAWLKGGLLTRLDLAFSRDQPEKIYVQHRMLENAARLWSWLEDGAHFYVCGDASRMARDVDTALHAIVEKAGCKSADRARAYVAKLKTDKRYQRDVY